MRLTVQLAYSGAVGVAVYFLASSFLKTTQPGSLSIAFIAIIIGIPQQLMSKAGGNKIESIVSNFLSK